MLGLVVIGICLFVLLAGVTMWLNLLYLKFKEKEQAE